MGICYAYRGCGHELTSPSQECAMRLNGAAVKKHKKREVANLEEGRARRR